MKFKFKIQQYQTDAVENTVAVFQGQPSHTLSTYRRDLGTYRDQRITYKEEETGYGNTATTVWNWTNRRCSGTSASYRIYTI